MKPSPHFQAVSRDRLNWAVRAGAAVSAVMLAVTLATAGGSEGTVRAAGVSKGSVTFGKVVNGTPDGTVITSGGSATEFAVKPPQNSACDGSGPAGYRWHMFIVANAVDIGSLTFDAAGPSTSGAGFTSPMYSVAGDPVTVKFPASSPDGLISGIPTVSFAAFSKGAFPAGTYQVGIACTKAGANLGYWASPMTFTTSATDPLGLTWSVDSSSGTTTTTSTTSTTSTTTTTVRPTTTIASSTTTSASTTTVRPTTTVSVNTLPAKIPSTGSSSTVRIALWAVLLLIFGRMALVLSRPVRVLPPKSR